MSYDPHCYDLAKLFLEDDQEVLARLTSRGIKLEVAVDRLAQKIQERVEEFTQFIELEMQ